MYTDRPQARDTAPSHLYVWSVVEVKVTVFITTTLDIKRKEIRNGTSELKSCVKVEVAVLGSTSLYNSPYGLCGRKLTLNLNKRNQARVHLSTSAFATGPNPDISHTGGFKALPWSVFYIEFVSCGQFQCRFRFYPLKVGSMWCNCLKNQTCLDSEGVFEDSYIAGCFTCGLLSGHRADVRQSCLGAVCLHTLPT